MSFRKPVNPPPWITSEPSLPVFRDWLMNGGNPNDKIEGKPLFLWLAENEWNDSVMEAWEAGADVNARDHHGQGWLHRAFAVGAPTWLTLEGFRRLNHTWWHPDHDGHTPFHVPVFDQRLSEAMIVRWWTEQRPWSMLTTPFDPSLSQLPQARRWRGWAPLLRP